MLTLEEVRADYNDQVQRGLLATESVSNRVVSSLKLEETTDRRLPQQEASFFQRLFSTKGLDEDGNPIPILDKMHENSEGNSGSNRRGLKKTKKTQKAPKPFFSYFTSLFKRKSNEQQIHPREDEQSIEENTRSKPEHSGIENNEDPSITTKEQEEEQHQKKHPNHQHQPNQQDSLESLSSRSDNGNSDEDNEYPNGRSNGSQEFDDPPPMPKLGEPVNREKLIYRNLQAQQAMGVIMKMVDNQVQQSIERAKNIPVSIDYDRVTVTPEINEYISKVRTGKQIQARVDENIASIQQVLNYRKGALITLNTNYSDQIVRKIEPIYVQEARTITALK